MSHFSILSVDNDNAKLAQSREFGFLSVGISLAQASTSGYNVCPKSSEACRNACVGKKGRAGVFPSIEASRIKKTRMLFQERDRFYALLDKDLAKLPGLARSLGLKIHFRTDVFSDVDWRIGFRDSKKRGLFDRLEALPIDPQELVSHDYTKDFWRWEREFQNHRRYNLEWNLTFSFSGENEELCLEVLRRRGRVAVPFDCKPHNLPRTWRGYRVVDGDVHDLQWLHGGGVVIGLAVKGEQLAQGTPDGFIQPTYDLSEQLLRFAH
jgi:hypothetical protein